LIGNEKDSIYYIRFGFDDGHECSQSATGFPRRFHEDESLSDEIQSCS
jgi:hypothetical protein